MASQPATPSAQLPGKPLCPRDDCALCAVMRRHPSDRCVTAPSVVVDEQDQILYLLGCSAEVLVSPLGQSTRRLHDLLHPLLTEPVQAICWSARQTGLSCSTPSHVDQDGSRRPLQITARPLSGAGLPELLSISFQFADLAPSRNDAAHPESDAALPGPGPNGRPACAPRLGAELSAAREADSSRALLEREIIELTQRQQQLGRALEGDISQALSAAMMLTARIHGKLARHSPDTGVEPELERLTEQMQQMLKGARTLAKDLAPTELGSDGLHAALSDLALRSQQAHGIRCSFHVRGRPRPTSEHLNLHLYRIAQEGLAAARPLAAVNTLEIVLEYSDRSLRLSLRHDGRPTPPSTAPGGLRLIPHHARIIGGHCRVTRTPQGATHLDCEVPYPDSASLDDGRSDAEIDSCSPA